MTYSKLASLKPGQKVVLSGQAFADEFPNAYMSIAHVVSVNSEYAIIEDERKVKWEINDDYWQFNIYTGEPLSKEGEREYFHTETVSLPDNPNWFEERTRASQEAFDRGASWVKRNMRCWPYNKDLAADLCEKEKALKFYWAEIP